MTVSTNPIVLTVEDRERLNTLIFECSNQRWGMDARALKALEKEVARAQVVDPCDLPEDVVTIDSKINVRDLDVNCVMRMCVCWPDRSDPLRGWVSVLAPLGIALLGTHEGDEVEWPVPDGRRRLRVEKVLSQPEADARSRQVVDT